MVLEHAPVTGLALIISSISTIITNERYNRPPHRVTLRRAATPAAAEAATHASAFTHLRRMCVESIPFGGLGASTEDALLSLGILAQMRTLERRWGSAAFLSFLLHAGVCGVCMVQLLTGPPSSGTGSVLDVLVPADGSNGSGGGAAGGVAAYFTPEAVRVLTGAASLVPLTALVVRYMSDIPSPAHGVSSPSTASVSFTAASGRRAGSGGGGVRIPGTSFFVTERATFLLPLAKLILFPNGTLQAATHKRVGVLVTVGLWTRLLLALVGVVFGMASMRSPCLRWWLRFVAEKVCAPLLNTIRPVLITPLFGVTKVATHVMPPHLQQGGMQTPPPPPLGRAAPAAAARWPAGDAYGSSRQEGGRISVGSLSGAADGGGGWAMPPVAQPATRRRHPERAGGAAESAERQAAVAQIMEMGLGRSNEEVANALRMCDGDVAAAVHFLLTAA